MSVLFKFGETICHMTTVIVISYVMGTMAAIIMIILAVIVGKIQQWCRK